jgi:hypothetical protein
LRSAHQNDLKTSKTYYFKAKKKKISNFLKSAFQQQCQTQIERIEGTSTLASWR